MRVILSYCEYCELIVRQSIYCHCGAHICVFGSLLFDTWPEPPSRAPVAEGKPAAHSSNPPAGPPTNGTARRHRCTPAIGEHLVHSIGGARAGLFTESVVTPQLAKREIERAHTHTYIHTLSHTLSSEEESCRKKEAKTSSARPRVSVSSLFGDP